MTIRCFIALTIPEEIQAQLANIQDQLKNNGAKARWVKPNNIHITLRFLGDQDPKRVKEIASVLPEMFAQRASFKLTIDKINAFPNINKPRILWAGVSDGATETIQLFDQLNEGLAKLGIPKDREVFVPHFTLARCKTPDESNSVAQAINPSAGSGSIQLAHLRSPSSINVGFIEKAPMFSIEAYPESITFYQSTLTSQGPIYNPIYTAIFT